MEGLISFLLFAGFFYLMMRFGCGAHMVHGHGASHGAQSKHNVFARKARDAACEQAFKLLHSNRDDWPNHDSRTETRDRIPWTCTSAN